MEYVNQLINEYGGVLNFIGGVLAVLGYIFGLWRYYKEQKARHQLEVSQQKLDETLARLKHLETLASGLKQFSAAV